MDNDSLFSVAPPLFLTITEDKQTVPVVPLGDDFFYSMDFLRNHAAETMQHGSANSPLWEAGFVNDNAQALRVYYQIPNVPDDVSGWGQTLYKVGNYFVYKVFDDKKREVYRKIEHDTPISPVFMVALSIAASGALSQLAGALGNAIMGSQAAAFPTLTQAVGNIALNTALNGGDVAGAVKSVVVNNFAGGAGGYVGNAVVDLTSVDLLGKIAQSATAAVIKGGNVLLAAAMPVVSFSGSLIVDSFSTPGGDMQLTNYFNDGEASFGDVSNGIGDISYGFNDPIQSPNGLIQNAFAPSDDGGGMYTFGDVNQPNPYTFDDQPMTTDPIPTGIHVDPIDGPIFTVPDIPIPDPSIYLPDVTSGGGTPGGGTDWAAAIAKLGTIAFQVWQANGHQNIKAATGSIRLPDGSVQTVQKNGTVITRSPSGQVTTTQLPVGQPYRFPDGTTIVNNGDGTYSSMGLNGQAVTRPIATGGGSLFSGGISAPVMLAGAALLILALRK